MTAELWNNDRNIVVIIIVCNKRSDFHRELRPQSQSELTDDFLRHKEISKFSKHFDIYKV